MRVLFKISFRMFCHHCGLRLRTLLADPYVSSSWNRLHFRYLVIGLALASDKIPNILHALCIPSPIFASSIHCDANLAEPCSAPMSMGFCRSLGHVDRQNGIYSPR